MYAQYGFLYLILTRPKLTVYGMKAPYQRLSLKDSNEMKAAPFLLVYLLSVWQVERLCLHKRAGGFREYQFGDSKKPLVVGSIIFRKISNNNKLQKPNVQSKYKNVKFK